ncbi:MAG: hypothetical protein Q8O84_03985, partial [Nanoarchaeota archaeon]|nr:hypothetical protein [Nanoarchaeota archaeon]
KVKELVNKYGDAICLSKIHDEPFWEYFKDKNYCILIFIKNVKKIEPFNINKKGYGLMSAWMCVEDIGKITKS